MLTEATSSPSTIKQAINSPELASVEDGIPGQHIIFIFLTYFKYAKEKNGYLRRLWTLQQTPFLNHRPCSPQL